MTNQQIKIHLTLVRNVSTTQGVSYNQAMIFLIECNVLPANFLDLVRNMLAGKGND